MATAQATTKQLHNEKTSGETTDSNPLRYNLKRGEDGRIRLQLDCANERVRPIGPRPRKEQAELQRGRWLILHFAVWSTQDVAAINVAASAILQLEGDLKLGLRPFTRYKEIEQWAPEIRDRFPSPIWLVYDGGALVGEVHGELSVDDVVAFVRSSLDDTSCVKKNGN